MLFVSKQRGDKPVTSSDPASESGSEPANPDEKALKIGIAMQSISTNPIFINAVQMIQTDCDKNGYTLITTDLVNGAEDIPNALENFVSAGCDIVLTQTPLRQRWKKCRRPVLWLLPMTLMWKAAPTA